MNQRLLSVLIFAFVVSAGASLLLYRLIASRVTANAKQPTTQVIVAARNLDLGTLIREADLRPSDWSGPLPRGSLLRKEDVVGRGVMSAIYDGEPILENRLAPKGAGAGLAATIPAGMRAVAVRVNDIVGVAGFVVPGMRVDILISGTPPGTQGSSNQTGTVSRTLLQNLEVLSAGQNFQKDTEGKPVQVQVVNLLVTPEQAEILSLASNETRIQLVLRNPLDTLTAKTNGTSLANLYGTAKPPEPPAPKPHPVGARVKLSPVIMTPPRPASPVAVEVINGNKRVESKFPASSEGIQ